LNAAGEQGHYMPGACTCGYPKASGIHSAHSSCESIPWPNSARPEAEALRLRDEAKRILASLYCLVDAECYDMSAPAYKRELEADIDALAALAKPMSIKGNEIDTSAGCVDAVAGEPVANSLPSAVFDKLQRLAVGGCDCCTKTPELRFHAENCTYRLASEITDLLCTSATPPRAGSETTE
jgi:hypothetical protein